jgi:aldose sugar dehydrogenase
LLSFQKASPLPTIQQSNNTNNQQPDIPQTTIIAQNLEVPWALAFLPDNAILVTERKGTVKKVDAAGNVRTIATLSQVKQVGEGGLLGITLHPRFVNNDFVYLYYTYGTTGNNTLNRVVQMTLINDTLQDETILVDAIPGSSNHNGGRIKFGPDAALYVTTGDAQEPSLAQDKKSLAGKIIRVDPNDISAIFSFGHRNPQGIAWDEKGNMWEVEHGNTATDEINKITKGENYGWPTLRGDQMGDGMIPPVLQSGDETWAPSGLAYFNKSLFFGGLKGEALFEAKLDGTTVKQLIKHFDGELGRIRDVVLGPDNMLYITTSNKDGRGNPKSGDDKIIRINPSKL